MTVSTTAAWRPNPGDTLTGKITDLSEHDAGYGLYPIVEVELADGSAAVVHAFHEVLQRELAKCAPKIGDEISVAYMGRSDGDRPYHRYKVRAPGATASIDWGRYGAGVEELLEPPVSDVPDGGPVGEPTVEPQAPRDDDIPF